ncbi:FAD-binding protein [Streptomyces alfalfae]|uniref:Isoquinoline biosynthesis protein n=1 Tax=Streptomyces alfalfae TaxID=1642299 RepID=A0ABN4VWI6_9ACTN|nr:FAD-binding protein [Streptomyces alfalfae]APY90243.1 isoquinoline biosynthesis protein [Streptomyces alfalfae]AYA20702.1 FAD-binding protein [Streptomyces fradiae]RXX34909.1 FAD-binding protein [Streptomyces alfalfae]RZM98014.1 FAD-binding protein [Streptomyces alfalfae]
MTTQPIEVTADDARYDALRRGFNQRWIAEPDYIVVATSADDVVAALDKFLADPAHVSRRLTVRSGGHCYENFVSSADVAVTIDVSQMNRAYFDPSMNAYCVEAGATNWHSTTQLYRKAGRALPGGSCYSVGSGGHISGGGYGLLSRLFGLTVDYLYAVEVVTVADGKKAKVTLAPKDSRDAALRDLWWAHTGGGGGNFGVITRYWFRDLPSPPAQVLLRSVAWEWKDLLKRPDLFKSLVRRYGQFFEHEQAGTGPDFVRRGYRDMFTLLKLTHVSNGKVGLIVQMDGTKKDSPDRLKAFLDHLTEGFAAGPGPHVAQTVLDRQMGEHSAQRELFIPTLLPWLTATQSLNESGPNRCGKYKSAYHTKAFTEQQIDAIHHHLTDSGYSNPDALLQIDSYGGKVNDVGPGATAVPQRSSVMKLQYQTYWTWNADADHNGVYDYRDAEKDARIAEPHLKWIRAIYAGVYKETKGVPAVADPAWPASRSAGTDGCYVNYPDVDLDDTALNTSGQRSRRLYYKANYARLQQTKQRWDPHNVFRHAQSVELPRPPEGTASPPPGR